MNALTPDVMPTLKARKPMAAPTTPPLSRPSTTRSMEKSIAASRAEAGQARSVARDGAGLDVLQRGQAWADGVHERRAVGDGRLAVDLQFAGIDERAVLRDAEVQVRAGREPGG